MQYHAWAIGSDTPGRSRASSTSDPAVVLAKLCPAISVSRHICPASPAPIALRHTLPLNSDRKQTEFGATDTFLGQGKGGVVVRDFLSDLSATIAGGTSEIPRNISAKLPASRWVPAVQRRAAKIAKADARRPLNALFNEWNDQRKGEPIEQCRRCRSDGFPCDLRGMSQPCARQPSSGRDLALAQKRTGCEALLELPVFSCGIISSVGSASARWRRTAQCHAS